MFKRVFVLFPIFFLCYSSFANERCKNLEKVTSEIKACNPHDIHITFDDGPSTAATEKILEELKKRKVKATFFISTTNLEKSSELKNLVKREIEEGHVVGNHGYDHNAYDLRIVNGKVEEKGYSSEEANEQLTKSVRLLNAATDGKFGQQRIKMFRFPYGRGAMPSPDELDYMEKHRQIIFKSKNYSERLLQYRSGNSRALASISDLGFSHLGWNHDSQDFKYGASHDSEMDVNDYVKENLKRMCASKEKTQVALFHDIKAINAKAIPLVIDAGRCLGLQFVSAQEMAPEKERLTSNGVLIPKDFQIKGAVKNMQGLDQLMAQLAGPKCELKIPPEHKSCISSNGKTYKHCEGEDSVCFDGEWMSRGKVILEGKCQ